MANRPTEDPPPDERSRKETTRNQRGKHSDASQRKFEGRKGRTVDEHSLPSLELSLLSQSLMRCGSGERDSSSLFEGKDGRFENEMLVLFASKEKCENEVSHSTFKDLELVPNPTPSIDALVESTDHERREDDTP